MPPGPITARSWVETQGPGPGFQGVFLGQWGLNPSRCQPGCQHTPCGGRGALLAPWHHLWTLAQPRGQTGSAHLPGNAEQPGSRSAPVSPGQPEPTRAATRPPRGSQGVSGTLSTLGGVRVTPAQRSGSSRAGRGFLAGAGSSGDREDKDRDVPPQPPEQRRAERPGTASPRARREGGQLWALGSSQIQAPRAPRTLCHGPAFVLAGAAGIPSRVPCPQGRRELRCTEELGPAVPGLLRRQRLCKHGVIVGEAPRGERRARGCSGHVGSGLLCHGPPGHLTPRTLAGASGLPSCVRGGAESAWKELCDRTATPRCRCAETWARWCVGTWVCVGTLVTSVSATDRDQSSPPGTAAAAGG